MDDSGTLPSYSNFCRVTATPEEVILDFGLNPQPFATGRQDVKANQRIVMNFYTAKRLLTALGMTLQRHEGTFGSVELDVRRRAGTHSSRPRPATQAGSDRAAGDRGISGRKSGRLKPRSGTPGTSPSACPMALSGGDSRIDIRDSRNRTQAAYDVTTPACKPSTR